MSDELAAIRERVERTAALQAMTQRLALAMAEEGFAIGSSPEPPYDEAYRIVVRLGLADVARLAIEREARASAEASVAAAIEALDALDGIVDDTHPEGDGCPLCGALDELRDALTDRAAAEAHDAAIRREAVEGVSKVDVRLVRESIVDQIGMALSRELAQGSPFEPFDRQYVIRAITAVLDDARKRIRFAAGSDA